MNALCGVVWCVGGCLKSKSPEGLKLTLTNNANENVGMKRKVISQYLFNMAFENTYDQGYVTEKPWDALYAGDVLYSNRDCSLAL